MKEEIEIRHNVFIEDATELSQELVYENANKILQLKYATEGFEKARNKHIWMDFLTRTGYMFKKKRLTIAEQKECILKLVLYYKGKYPKCFNKVGWWDKKVALQEAGEEE